MNKDFMTLATERYSVRSFAATPVPQDNIHPVLLMPFGYAAEDSKPAALHTKYRPLEETVEYI